MIKYAIRRLLISLPVLLLVSVIIFLGLELMPGDPISYRISPEAMANMSAEELDNLRELYGLNDPVFIRYFRWLFSTLKGDLGISITNGAPIIEMLEQRVPVTLELVGSALIVSTFFGIAMGFISAVKKNTVFDYSNAFVGILGISIPSFFLGLVFIRLFALELSWFPVTGRMPYGAVTFWDRFPNLVLPCLALAFNLTGTLMRYTRSSMVDVLTMDYVKTARSKGLPMFTVYFRHAFRNALMPVIYLLCFRIPLLIGGSVVIESTFGWNGLGQMLLDGLNANNYPVIMTVVMTSAVVVLLSSLLVDILTAMLDPRVRLE